MTVTLLAEPADDARTRERHVDATSRVLADARPGLVLLAMGLTGSRHAAEDVVQDVIEAVLRNGTGFAAAQAPVGYLRTAVVNRCRSLHRRAFVRRRWEQQQNLDEMLVVSGADERARSAELMTALRELTLRQREVILFRYWHDLPFDEIARLLDIPPTTARSIASRAIRALADLLEGSHA